MTFSGLSTFVVKEGMGTYKQGNLHIKRERPLSTVSSMLFKPWQTGYFCLYKNPYILKEYKDSSLRNLRHTHFIATVKHVSKVNTSKSQPYAFELLMEENTPLLFGCDNPLLQTEWIKVFNEIIDEIKDLEMKNAQISFGRETIPETYTVNVIETKLSNSSNLHGDYLMILAVSRVYLLDKITQVEVLSWPLSHVTFHSGQSLKRRITLIMGRNCHFGNGKLTFESIQIEPIIDFFNNHFQPQKLNNSYKGNCITSNSSSSANSESSYPVSPRDLSRLNSTSFDQSVFENPSFSSRGFLKSETIDVLDGDVSSYAEIKSEIENPDSDYGEVLDSDETHSFIEFGEITTGDDSYITPNEPEEGQINPARNLNEEKRFSKELSRIKEQEENLSENEANNIASYVHLYDDEEEVNKLESVNDYELLDSVVLSLIDPQRNTSILKTRHFPGKSKSLTVENKTKLNSEIRRASEPAKVRLCSQLNHDRYRNDFNNNKDGVENKLYRAKEIDSLELENEKSKISPFSRRKKAGCVKQNSITHEKEKSVFQMAEKHFVENTSSNKLNRFPHSLNRKNILYTKPLTNVKLPDLDRNTKPKKLASVNNKIENNTLENMNESLQIENISPPPIPERHSPQLSSQRELRRAGAIDKSDENISDHKKSDDKQNKNNPHILPPPLPPKGKPLALTKSVPISKSMSLAEEEEPRRSSFGTAPDNEILKSSNLREEEPPQVPSRNQIQPIEQIHQKLSSSQSSILDVIKSFSKSSFLSDNSVDDNGHDKNSIPRNIGSTKIVTKSLDAINFSKLQIDNTKRNYINPNNYNMMASDISSKYTSRTRGHSVTEFNEQVAKASTANMPNKLIKKDSNSGFPKSPISFF